MKTTTLFTLLTLLSLPIMAQKKLFTINDLIPGGSTYYAHSNPATKHLAWWGDTCIELGIDQCQRINKHSGADDTGSALNTLTLENINNILSTNGRKTINHFYNASFPYTEKPYILIDRDREQTLIDWVNKQVVWKADLHLKAHNEDWNKNSQSTAYTIDHNLFVLTADGKTHQVSTDGSTDLTYGDQNI